MDPLDHIAHIFTRHCHDLLHHMLEVKRVVDAHGTVGDAIRDLVLHGRLPTFTEPRHIDILVRDIPRYRRCVARMADIKALARRVLRSGFPCGDGVEDQFAGENPGGEEGAARGTARPSVFDHEICFSYASKMLVSMGLPLAQYSDRPSNDEIVRAELAVAMRTPFLSLAEDPAPPSNGDDKDAGADDDNDDAAASAAGTDAGSALSLTDFAALSRLFSPPPSSAAPSIVCSPWPAQQRRHGARADRVQPRGRVAAAPPRLRLSFKKAASFGSIAKARGLISPSPQRQAWPSPPSLPPSLRFISSPAVERRVAVCADDLLCDEEMPGMCSSSLL